MAAPARPSRRLGALRLALVAVLLAGLALGGWIGWFYVHSAVSGDALLRQVQHRMAALHRPGSQGPECTAASGAVAELAIPRLRLVAPIVQGDGDAQLSDAVGHVPTSAWPGGHGTVVLAAHDVTWFHGLDALRPGDDIEYLSGCRAVTYRVTSAGVVPEGAALPDVAGHLALVTCWPLDALWFTGQRYLVEATEVGGAAYAPPVRLPTAPSVPTISVPAGLASVASLSANPTPLGTLSIEGRPSSTFESSPGPLADAAAAQDLFFAAQRAAQGSEWATWAVVAPGVPMAGAEALEGQTVTNFGTSLSTVLTVKGGLLVGATVSVEEVLGGAGEWAITATEALAGKTLVLTGWEMVPA